MEPHAPESLKGLNILVVEDNKVSQIMAKSMLMTRGMLVDIAENGEIAVKMVNHKRYDIVLMDIQMPVMDGYESARTIRAQEDLYSKNLPIIAVTATLDGEMILASGMNDFLEKPLKAEEVLGKISICLGR